MGWPQVLVLALLFFFCPLLLFWNIRTTTAAGQTPTPLVALQRLGRRARAALSRDPAALWLSWAVDEHYFVEACACLQRAVDLGSVEARFEQGLLCAEGGMGPAGEAAALDHFRRAAQAGHAEAAFRLAEGLRWRRLGAGDADQALAWYLRSARGGFGPAMAWLAQALEAGDGAAADAEQAAAWRRALEALEVRGGLQGLRHSRIVGLREAGREDALVRTGRAVGGTLERLGERHVAPLAEHRLFGLGLAAVACALALAIACPLVLGCSGFFFLPAVGLAPIVLWVLLQRRRGYSRAGRRLEVRAAAGEAEACFLLGRELEGGSPDRPRDPAAARDWYRRAAGAGHPEAMFRLADLLLWGAGGGRDRAEALLLLERAAGAGQGEAARRLERERREAPAE